MAKAKGITIASIMKAMNICDDNVTVITIGEGENLIELNIKKRLSLYERSDMVNSIASMVWAQDDDGLMQFAPYLRKFAYDFSIINYFTNISLPSNTEKIWEFVEKTNITNMIVDVIGQDYIGGIIREASELIEYRKSENLKHSKFDGILNAVSNVMGSLDTATKNIDMPKLLELVEKYAPGLKGQFEQMLQKSMDEGLTEDLTV